MKNSIFIFSIAALAACAINASAQAPDTLWTCTYGGDFDDRGECVQQTTEGGYIIGGYTNTYGSGSYDCYLVKTNADGDTLWTQTYGGNSDDRAYCVQQTIDEGYIIGGYTNSFGAGSKDFYLVKTDNAGNMLWTRSYGGSGNDHSYSVRQTTDEGYILVGSTQSYGAGSLDCYLIKTDSDGDTLWTRTYGGSAVECGRCVQQTDDGGYIITGYTSSYGAGSYDVYIIKTDSIGDTLWTRYYGSSYSDQGFSVQQTTDGGYIVAGDAPNYSAGVTGVYLIKTDMFGDTLWTNTYSGNVQVCGYCVEQTTDGGYIIAGDTYTFGTTSWDPYLVRTNAYGDTLWTHVYSGTEHSECHSIQQTSDNGYIATGYTSNYSTSTFEVYLIRLEADTPTPPIALTLTPLTPPIQIPSGGGSFNFDLEIENGTLYQYTADIGIDVTLPGGGNYPILLRSGISLWAGALLVREDLTQFVPAGASAGDYIYNGYVYDHTTWEILAENHFDFEKLAGDGIPAHNRGWALYGWNEEDSQASIMPTDIAILSVFPNPFNAETTISFTLPKTENITVSVFDVMGKEVTVLASGEYSAGNHNLKFDGKDLSSGVYFVRLKAEGNHLTQKLILMK